MRSFTMKVQDSFGEEFQIAVRTNVDEVIRRQLPSKLFLIFWVTFSLMNTDTPSTFETLVAEVALAALAIIITSNSF